jgi:acyl dehydratase
VQFDSPPSVWSSYARALAAQRPPHLPEGSVLPRLEARLNQVRIDAAQLARYRELCGAQCGPGYLPIAFPHLLATPIHLALLASPGFPVRLLGLVHVANVIQQWRPIAVGQGGEIVAWLEGYRDTARGQQFDLETEWRDGGTVLWRETCTFLARRRRGAASALRRDSAPDPHPSGPIVTAGFRAPAGLGRQYGRLSGDVNPIHLADVTARLFGFQAAIAHGMWSLARCAAELPPDAFAGAVRYAVDFKLPVYLPAWVMLQHWRDAACLGFALRDAQGERAHLTGTLQAVAA